MTVDVGDWVRFMSDGRLVVAVVQYLKARASWERHDSVVTEIGPVSVDHILEVRKP